MQDQRRRVKYNGTPTAVWLMPRDGEDSDRYELWANGAITVRRNTLGDYRTAKRLVRNPQ
ncbi:hypothetical protein [Coleofasciculus sp. FACHB-SPT36]|uniref:hypothetical protein n=1 Tax=Cyanophyceae TaxID=3028117 RepID=UPI00168AF71A|nr:hypothetical protein [Coleofasciculus sp. FACHB-SPT36]MBD2537516.1 hypothetical protein [Coleofasciculus sp. FACHB-SPT36]